MQRPRPNRGHARPSAWTLARLGMPGARPCREERQKPEREERPGENEENMAQIVIRTNLSASAALSCASASCGDLDVPLTSDQIAQLTDAQRAALTRFAQPGDHTPSHFDARLSVTGPGLPGIVAALDARADHDAADAAKLQAQIAAELAELRAGTREWAPNYSKDVPEAQALWRAHEDRKEAARVAAVLAADAALGDDPAAHLTADLQVDDATDDVLRAARVYRDSKFFDVPPPPRALAVRALSERLRSERVKAYAQACHAYVIAHDPEFRRAAEDGHDVTGIAEGRVTDLLGARLATVAPLAESHGRDEPRECPSAAAYAVLDAVRALDLSVPGIVDMTRTELVRIDVWPTGTRREYRTAVRVTLTWADGTEGTLYVLADPAGLPDLNDDSDK